MTSRLGLALVLHARGGRHRGRRPGCEYLKAPCGPPVPILVLLIGGMTPGLCQSHTGSESSSNSRKEMLPKPVTIVTSESSSTCFVRSEEFSFASSHAVTTQTPAQVA